MFIAYTLFLINLILAKEAVKNQSIFDYVSIIFISIINIILPSIIRVFILADNSGAGVLEVATMLGSLYLLFWSLIRLVKFSKNKEKKTQSDEKKSSKLNPILYILIVLFFVEIFYVWFLYNRTNINYLAEDYTQVVMPNDTIEKDGLIFSFDRREFGKEIFESEISEYGSDDVFIASSDQGKFIAILLRVENNGFKEKLISLNNFFVTDDKNRQYSILKNVGDNLYFDDTKTNKSYEIISSYNSSNGLGLTEVLKPGFSNVVVLFFEVAENSMQYKLNFDMY